MQLNHRWMTREERRRYAKEQAKDPMGIIASTIHLLVPEYMQIAGKISNTYVYENLITEALEGKKRPSNLLSPELKMQIYDDIYAQLIETDEIKRFRSELENMIKTLSNSPNEQRIKRSIGRPKKSAILPETALMNMIFAWAIDWRIWPLPKYFYVQFNKEESKRSVTITPEFLEFFKEHCENVPEKSYWVEKPNDKKLYRKELTRDAWVFLTYCYMKEEDSKKTYADLAEILVETGSLTGEPVDYEEDAEKYLDECEITREKIKRSCSRFKQYVLSIIDIPS